jgi:hypothetical protein
VTGPAARQRRPLPGLVFAAGLLIQGLQAFGPAAPPVSFLKYPVLAERFVAGELDPERLFDVSFLYFYLHALVRAMTTDAELVVRCLQVVAVALTAALLFIVGERLLSRGAGVAAAALFLFDRTVSVYTAILEPEALLGLAVVAFVWASLREPEPRPALAGILLGVGLLLRPTLLPLALVAPLWLVPGAGGARQIRRRLAVFLLPVAVALGALWLRNAALPGPFSPSVMNPGAAFFEGNHPWATGLAVSYPPLLDDLLAVDPDSPDPHHELYRLVARREAGRELSVAEVNAVWIGRGLAFIADHPGRAFRQVLVKLGEAFRGYAWHDLDHAYWRERRLAGLGVPAVPFALVAALALLGMAMTAAEWRRWLPLYAVMASQIAVMIVIYVSARQKLTLVPVLVIFAAAAGERLVRQRRGRVLLAAAGLALAAALWLPNDASREDRHLWEGLRRSNELRREALARRAAGELEPAAEAAARSLVLTPWRADQLRPAGVPFGPEGFAGRALAELEAGVFAPTPSRRFDEATLALEASELERASSVLASLIERGWVGLRGSYQSSEPRVLLAQAALASGDWAGAARLAAVGLEHAPGDPAALALVAVLGPDDEAARDLDRYYGPIHRAFFLGRAALAAGDAERAVEELTGLVVTLPELRRARIYLAAALAATGRDEAGALVFLAATASEPEPLLLEDEIVALFERWAAADPEDSERAAALARVRKLYGRLASGDGLAPASSLQEGR